MDSEISSTLRSLASLILQALCTYQGKGLESMTALITKVMTMPR